MIADESVLIRSSIKQLFSEEKEIRITAEADTYSELFQTLNIFTFDILILDFNFHEKNGLEMLKELKISYPQLSVIIISSRDEIQTVIKTFEANVKGFVRKADLAEELVEAVKTVNQGGEYISKHLREKYNQIKS